jgi:hypothetical protein
MSTLSNCIAGDTHSDSEDNASFQTTHENQYSDEDDRADPTLPFEGVVLALEGLWDQ